ncbi:MAG TPA: ROK family protein [Lacipirellulaceae bacterium]|nr:ROK family protein [Lacipirellulaceae bacterium]
MEATIKFALGVDIGGTKVAAGLVDFHGTILHQTRVSMPARGSTAAGFAAVQSAIDAIFKARPDARANLTGIGICAPGPLDPKTGVILNPPNVPCWRNFPLAAEIQCVFGLHARVDNDGNAAALAEAIWGAGVGHRNVFYATLGTGIGTGIVFDGRIYHGRTGSAAEGGHVSIDYRGPVCGCGKRGCIEALAAGPAIVRRAREHVDAVSPSAPASSAGSAHDTNSTSSKMLALTGDDLDAVTAETIAEAYRQGDLLATQVLEETADLLAVWAGNVIDLLEPDVFLFGGGLAPLMSAFFPRIRQQLTHCCVNQRFAEIPILLAKYGPDAGIAGAAALCRA